MNEALRKPGLKWHHWVTLGSYQLCTLKTPDNTSCDLTWKTQSIPKPDRKDTKDEEEEDEIAKEEPEEDENDEDMDVKQEDEEAGPAEPGEQDMLPDFQHRFEQQLRQSTRSLKVKDLIIAFESSSIYGRRSAFLKGLLVTVS